METPVETPVTGFLLVDPDSHKCATIRQDTDEMLPQPGKVRFFPAANIDKNLMYAAGEGSLGNPRKLMIFLYLSEFFCDFWSNIKVLGQNNVIVELLRQK